MRKYAVVVGIGNYDKVARSANLRYSQSDAIEFARCLVNYCGYTCENIKLFVDSNYSGSRVKVRTPLFSEILAAIYEMCQKNNAHQILFYFSGHGFNNYLLTNETRLNITEHTAISLQLINQFFDESEASSKVRFIDACRNEWATPSLQKNLNGMSLQMAKAIFHKSKASVTFSACGVGEFSYEDEKLRNGVFTYFLLEAIQGAAESPNGGITISSIDDYVTSKVQDWAHCKGYQQNPHLLMDKIGVLNIASLFPESIEPEDRHLAIEYYEKGCKLLNLDEKETAFRESLKLNPFDILCYESLANVLIKKKSYDDAVFILRKAITLHPKYSKAYLLMGEALKHLKVQDEISEKV